MKQRKGISLIVLVITIIIMIIISGAIILTLTETNVIDQAEDATYAYNNKQYFELIRNEYLMLRVSDEAKGKTSIEIFEMLKEKIDKNAENVEYITGSKAMNITIDNTYKYTAFYDGEVKYGKYAYLDIADGSIQLKNTGYIQGTNPLVEYDGDYIITGTTTENTVKVMEEGTYNITIKDLNIDVSSVDKCCAFNANAENKATGVFVNLYIDGDNKLYAGSHAAALGFANANPNIEEVTNASKLTIQGQGHLYAVGKGNAAGIGTSFIGAAAGDANNITINSGNITAISVGGGAAAIGGGNGKNANNIIINGGNIIAKSSYGQGIGAERVIDNIVINGGNIKLEGGEYGGAIGGNASSGKVKITGGIIKIINDYYRQKTYSLLGNNCSSIEITGGTIIGNLKQEMAIGTTDVTQNISITGGSVYMDRKDNLYAIPPTSETNNVYLTEIQLLNVT